MWCYARRIAPWYVAMQQIAEFLHDLFKKGDMKVRTIEGYISWPLLSLLRQEVWILILNPTFAGLLVLSFYTDRPVEINLVPHWDLTVVLDVFTKSPFELGIWLQWS